MTVSSTRHADENPGKDHVVQAPILDLLCLGLPNEVLVKIISFLPETRDRVKLRYVSKEIRSISETPSLWRDFVWPDCNPCEAECLHNVMKACGVYIRRLSFPQHLIQPTYVPQASQKLMKMLEMTRILQYCTNLTHLDLPAVTASSGELDTQLKVIEEMKHLEVLSIHCKDSFQPYLSLKIALKELTVHTDIFTLKDAEAWMMNEFSPSNLNIIAYNGSLYLKQVRFKRDLMRTWPTWNSQIPAGHTACLRLYIGYKAPLNLFQNMPVLQLRYGEAVTPPFVQASSAGIADNWLQLTDCNKGGKMAHMAKVYLQPPYIMLRNQGQDCNISDLSYLTELDMSRSNLDIKQIVFACPQLRRLSLKNNQSLRVEDLQAIATHCYNLQGLNLMRISVTDIQFCLKTWEILSDMKLTHLSMDVSFVGSNSIMDGAQEKRLVAFFRQCTTLQALELHSERFANPHTANINYAVLSNFPSLEYCRFNDSQMQQSTCAQDILITCKRLRCFYYSCSTMLSASPVHNSTLQQLCISSGGTVLDDHFMETVSAHGGLVHVALFVYSVSINGITSLIKNSPNLLTFTLHEQNQYEENHMGLLSALLGRKFADRKLFTSGLLYLMPQAEDFEHDEYDEWLQNTDLVSLWPPDQFRDFPVSRLMR